MTYLLLDSDEARSNRKEFINEILRLSIRIVFFFSGSFQSTDSLPSSGKNTGVESFLFSVACLDNSAGWASLKLKFRVEFLLESE